MKYIFPLLVASSFLVSCKRHKSIKADIFERKQLSGNRLMIKYKYDYNRKICFDSATIKNLVINDASIDLIMDPAAPGRWIPDIK